MSDRDIDAGSEEGRGWARRKSGAGQGGDVESQGKCERC